MSSRYLGTPEYEHGTPDRLGILLVNLGTPDSPEPADVRRFLAEFLWDPRVIEVPRWIWWLALHGLILRTRPAKSSHAYKLVWTTSGSPLLLHSRALAEGVKKQLEARFGDSVRIVLGMTYGNPSIASALQMLMDANVRRLIVLPLYPQYSATTTGSVFDRVSSVLQRWRWLPELRFVTSYHDETAYIDAIAGSIQKHWQSHERSHLLFSFHGIPRDYLLAGDPYHCQCVKTARLVSERLGLSADDWSLSFQSQVGRAEWLRPYTDELLKQHATQGRTSVTVACPGFATDCLETLEEIALRNRDTFLSSGGRSYSYVPALNAGDAHVGLLCNLVDRHIQGWPQPSTASDSAPVKARAAKYGAAR